VRAALPGAPLSIVNIAEIVTKLCERGMPAGEARIAVEAIGVELVAFTAEQGCSVGELGELTRAAGLSLGDRACLARERGLPAITAETDWCRVPGFDIVALRGAGS
jgi:ribonuclease VapC